MKKKDKEFIREIISSDLKQISNPNFTSDTIEKIVELKDDKVNFSYWGDITFLIPVIIYVSLSIVLSLLGAIISWPHLGQINNLKYSIEMISSFLVNPVTMSILFSFSLLYLFDLFLQKVST